MDYFGVETVRDIVAWQTGHAQAATRLSWLPCLEDRDDPPHLDVPTPVDLSSGAEGEDADEHTDHADGDKASYEPAADKSFIDRVSRKADDEDALGGDAPSDVGADECEGDMTDVLGKLADEDRSSTPGPLVLFERDAGAEPDSAVVMRDGLPVLTSIRVDILREGKCLRMGTPPVPREENEWFRGS